MQRHDGPTCDVVSGIADPIVKFASALHAISDVGRSAILGVELTPIVGVVMPAIEGFGVLLGGRREQFR